MSIAVRNITKRFGSFTAVDDISLDFPSGQLIALLGPSGCGKTTLLRVIAGLEWADSGQVLLNGEDASHRHVRERQVGFVFQHYALFKHMSVFENIAFGLRVKPRAQRSNEQDIRARVGALLELVQLSWLADRYPSQLSGGQRQRVALARALAVEPRVLLLDEPFGALDAKVRKELRAWLRRLHGELKLSSIFVTHDQDEALEVADRIVLMNNGRVEQQGAAQEVYERPATAFACRFLGATNRLHGRLDGTTLVVAGDRIPVLPHDVRHGEPAVSFARPHEFQIVPHPESGIGLKARVDRIRSNGAVVRIELSSERPHNGSSDPDLLEVELTRDALAALHLSLGQKVRLVAPGLRAFPDHDATNAPRPPTDIDAIRGKRSPQWNR